MKPLNLSGRAAHRARYIVRDATGPTSSVAGDLILAGAFMARVFFSYSHADEGHRDRLEKSLAMLKRQGLIETWHDRRIPAGAELDRSISTELEKADVVLLLVSPDFLDSGYCFEIEMTRALERHDAGEARVIPIILRPCDWHASPLSKLMATPSDGRPITKWPDLDEAFQDVVESIRRALPKPREKPRAPEAGISAAVPIVLTPGPRSSNLRLAKRFSEADRDAFLHDAFQYMAAFFEGSLAEIEVRNRGIRTAFRRIDANRFTAVAYRDGEAKARCKIMLGGMLGNGITYANSDGASDNTMNEMLSVASDDQGLYLDSMGMAHFGRSSAPRQHLSFEGAAELYWGIFIEPMQQTLSV
jgi:hypothetical protein